MKVVLYGLLGRPRAQWEISLDIRVDCTFWFEQYGGAVSVLVLEPAMSLGQALALKEGLNRSEVGGIEAESVLQMARELGREAGVPGRVLAAWRLDRVEYGSYLQKRYAAPELSLAKLERLEAELRGRSLTREELAGLVEGAGLEPSLAADWPSYVQAAYLRGTVGLVAGLECVGRESGWGWAARLLRLLPPWGREAVGAAAGRGVRQAKRLHGLGGRKRRHEASSRGSVLSIVRLLPGLNRRKSGHEASSRWGGLGLVWRLLGLKSRKRGYAPGSRVSDGKPPVRELRGLRCRRCGSGASRLHATECPHCGGPCAYCEACLALGRQRECSLLVRGLGPLQPSRPPGGPSAPTLADDAERRLGKWGLSPAQRAAVQEALAFHAFAAPPHPAPGRAHPAAAEGRSIAAQSTPIVQQLVRSGASARVGGSGSHKPWPMLPVSRRLRGFIDIRNRRHEMPATFHASTVKGAYHGPSAPQQPRSFLIWAVTGAGKTEMIFPLIEAELARGGAVLIATPRRDVVLELRPRIERAFPERSVVTLYGGSEDRWKRGDITLATTHQLMRFHQAFDLIIIDELDAFPYHNNPELQFAAAQVCKPQGLYILLSATPPAQLQREVRRKRLAHVRVPVRFHRHPLPIPKLLRCKRNQPLSSASIQAIERSLARGAQLFVFVPKIKEVDTIVLQLRKRLAKHAIPIEGTSSQDPERTGKVSDFRAGRIRILVTTTILERGVTVPKTDVFILQADSRLFDEASLVQMAGRAGRSKDDPYGFVYFIAPDKTNAQAGAIRQIRQMNKLAREKGYLLPERRTRASAYDA
ncbi:helicase-related protein [Paenibacillus koleovorans]|uniref:helicase-related protein n=1 Tax=Paenibacillus koleovorans TaxID=121608 RepID=UPI001FE35DD8|nr:helicase-related protein [Paenibacillus koleovorans]